MVIEIFCSLGQQNKTVDQQHTSTVIHPAMPARNLKNQKSLSANFGLALMHEVDQTVLCDESLLTTSLPVVSLRDLQANQGWKTRQAVEGTKV